MWSEVAIAKKENRRELVLTGRDIGTKIEEHGLDENVYDVIQLNFLEISRASLAILSPKIGNLINLTSLVLHCNKLDKIPSTICKLTKLKLLDISLNELDTIPEEIGALRELQTLNASSNKLTSFVNVSNLIKLHSLDISNNLLKELPNGIDNNDLKLLSTISAQRNKIEALPESLRVLPSLKTLDVSNNKITTLPPQLGNCGKLKDFNCKENDLKDGRLMKLVKSGLTKPILDYLRGKIEATGGRSKKGKKDVNVEESDEGDEKDVIRIKSFDVESSLMIKMTGNAIQVRPFIVCCVIRNVNFSKSPTLMKQFIKIQTRLHEDICVNRLLSTIATHDLEKVKGPLLYDALEPSKLKIHPLKESKEVTAQEMVTKHLKEADDARKAKKRNELSSTHRYLVLLAKHDKYPCLKDVNGVTISFPPITNSEDTKVTEATKHILIEVTGDSSAGMCKKVMELLLTKLIEMGICQEEERPAVPTAGADSDGGDGERHLGKKQLIVEQVKVIDELNNLRVIFPSRADLKLDDYKVIRDGD